MELTGARVLVAGATGELGGRIAGGLAARGARLVVAGRDAGRLSALGAEMGAPTVTFEALDTASCRRAVRAAAEQLGGLDVLVVAVGVAAFARAEGLDDAVAEELFAVNTLAPLALVSEALAVLEDGGTVVALSAVVADFPTADMAAYSASKAALSAYLAAVRRERRTRRVNLLDVRPQHMETGFSSRALAGEPPPLPAPADAGRLVELLLDALADGRREIAYDVRSGQLTVR